MIDALDAQADALLERLIEQHGGDVRAACLMLCAGVTLADIVGETYERALARAVSALFRHAEPIPTIHHEAAP